MRQLFSHSHNLPNFALKSCRIEKVKLNLPGKTIKLELTTNPGLGY